MSDRYAGHAGLRLAVEWAEKFGASVATVPTRGLIALLAERDRLLAENRALAAGQCIVRGGLVADDGGNQHCALQRELDAALAREKSK